MGKHGFPCDEISAGRIFYGSESTFVYPCSLPFRSVEVHKLYLSLIAELNVFFLTVLSCCILFSKELKKSGTWKPQLELYKKEIAELHQRLTEETKRADKNDFECKNMQEKLSAIQREKEVGGYEVM